MLLRFAVTLAILIPFFLSNLHRPIWQTFLIALLAFGTGRLVEYAVLGTPTAAGARKPAPAWLKWALLAVAIVGVWVGAMIWLRGGHEPAAAPTVPQPDAAPPPPPPIRRAGLWRSASVNDKGACGLKDDGTAWCWGQGSVLGRGANVDLDEPVPVPGLGAVTAVSTGSGHGCALDATGAAWCWGWNYDGAVGVPPTGSYDARETAVQVPIAAPLIAVSAGTGHSCALDADGGVWCWGWNDQLQLGVPRTGRSGAPARVPGLAGVRTIDVGRGASCAVTTDDRLLCWGDLSVAGASGAEAANTTETPTEILTDVVTADVGESQACAVKRDGTVWCWGWWAQPRGEPDYRKLHRRDEIADARAVAVGVNHACAVLGDGGVRCWGANYQGQLGDGTITEVSAAMYSARVRQLPPVTQVAAGELETCGLTADGALWCWGHVVPLPRY